MPWRAVLRDTARIFSRHDGRMLAGATAFFALVSVAPMLLLALVVAGAVVDARTAHTELLQGLGTWLGADGARAVAALLANAQASTSRTEVTALSAAVIVWGATRLFSNLQRALDHLWGVRARDHEALRDKAVKQVKRRALSFALVTLCGTALVVAIAVRTAFSAAERLLPVALPTRWHLLDHGLTLGALGALFAVVFRVLPHARVAWRDALVGAAVTTVLFALGRVLVSLYLRRKSLDSTFGAAGSVVALLLWVYYSAQIFFLGAAFLAARARHLGRPLAPTDDAVAVREDDTLSPL